MSASTRLLLVLCLCGAGCGARTTGATLLAQGRNKEVLRTVRSVDPGAAWIRACAWWRLGNARETRKELLLGLSRDRNSAVGHRLVGAVEAQVGARGAALRHLQRSLELKPEQPTVREAVAWLLLRRALQRVGAGMGAFQEAEAQEDVQQALRLQPSLKPQACALASFFARTRPASTAVPESPQCPGPPLLELARATRAMVPRKKKRCTGRALEKIRRQHLLVSCRGVGAALRLEGQGCPGEAGAIWDALITEAPSDPRWYLLAARNLLARGKPARARQLLVHHLYLSRDRAGALLDQARILLEAGYKGRAGRRAVEAMAFARDGPRLAEARALLQQCGVQIED